MKYREDVEELKEKRICAVCIGEAFLRDRVEKEGEEIETLIERIGRAMDGLFEP